MSVFVIILALHFAACRGLQWSKQIQVDSGPVEICSGQNIRLLWNYTLNKDERVKDMVWTCQPEDKATEQLASYVDDTFMPMSEFSGRLSHLQDGGKELSCATILESGNYSVTVNTVDYNGDETLYRQTAWVKVVDTPKTLNGRIEVRQEREAVRDDTSDRQWHVHLTCGHFSDLGHPAVEAEWKTPNGETLSSSYFHKGNFHLLLSNPVKGGNYTCSLPSLSPATRCLPPGSALRDDVTVYVDEVAARFSIMEAHQVAMETRLDEERAAFVVFRDNTSLEKSQMQGEMEDLKIRLDAASTRVSFHSRLKNDLNNFQGRFQPFNIITNEGDALNGTTGIFTTPRNGTYFFVASSSSSIADRYVHMSLMKEGTSVAFALSREYSNYYATATCHATLHLTVGERVWVESTHSSTHYYSTSTSFTGFLLGADDW